MEIYFYDFLGTGRAPTLAHPIVGVHSMLPPPKKKQKKNNYGGVIWCVLVYILIRFFLKKKKYIFYAKVVIFSYTLNCWSMTLSLLHPVGLRLQVYHIQFLEGNKVPLAFPLNTPEHFCLFL